MPSKRGWKRIFLVLVLPACVIAALFLYFKVLQPPKPKKAIIQMTVTVYEGAVNLSRLDVFGNPVFLRVVEEGETAQVAVSTREFEHPGIFSFAESFFAKGIAATVQYVETVTTQQRKEQFSRRFTEDELNEFAARLTAKYRQVSNPILRIHADGFEGSCRAFGMSLYMKGYVGIDAREKPYLTIREARMGNVKLPKFMLKRLEDAFYKSVEAQRERLRLLNIEYSERGLLITCRRASKLEDMFRA